MAASIHDVGALDEEQHSLQALLLEVEPSFSTLQEILRACGYQLSTHLEKYVAVDDERRKQLARRAQRAGAADARPASRRAPRPR